MRGYLINYLDQYSVLLWFFPCLGFNCDFTKDSCCLWSNLVFCDGFIILVYLVLVGFLNFSLPVSPFSLKILGIQNMFTKKSWFCLKLVCQSSLRCKMRDFLERSRRESKYSSPLSWNYLYIIKE